MTLKEAKKERLPAGAAEEDQVGIAGWDAGPGDGIIRARRFNDVGGAVQRAGWGELGVTGLPEGGFDGGMEREVWWTHFSGHFFGCT